MQLRGMLRILIALGLLHASQAFAVKELRMGSPWSTAIVLHVGAAEFVKEVDKLSKGQLKVNLFPDAQLGDIQALVTGTQTGTVDLVFLGPANASVLKGGTALNVVYVPYLFNSRDVVEKIINGPLFQRTTRSWPNNLTSEFSVVTARACRADC